MRIRVCNNFGITVFVAFAYRENGDWTSRGWLRVPPEACKDARLPTTDVAYRAESNWYENGDHNSRNMWGHAQRFCVREGRFMYRPARDACEGGELSDFSKTLSSSGNIRLTLEKNGRDTTVTYL
jgi:uncharacterized membrane protein